jgi:hypothetical protein
VRLQIAAGVAFLKEQCLKHGARGEVGSGEPSSNRVQVLGREGGRTESYGDLSDDSAHLLFLFFRSAKTCRRALVVGERPRFVI